MNDCSFGHIVDRTAAGRCSNCITKTEWEAKGIESPETAIRKGYKSENSSFISEILILPP